MAQPVLSLTEFAEFTSLVSFVNSIVPPGTQVIRGQQNRVAEPSVANFVVLWPLRYERLSTNIASFYDNVITASINGETLTVSEITQQESPLSAGMALTDGLAGVLNNSTVIVGQVSGATGGIGVYTFSPSPQNVPAETMYAGQRQDFLPTQWTVQCDVHGPNSANVAQVLMTLWRSEVAVDAVGGSTDFAVVPLYAEEARYMPFLNAEQAWEYRWTLDLTAQVNPVVGTQQDFADKLEPTLHEFS